ncbi:MAG: hypothetical protein NT150_09065 [Bacteroidetes bacterium]|nr:hypothetical protein [Bacteroidota bacterium]
MRLFTQILALLLLPASLLAQPLITNETVEKMYFDDFTDDSQNWPTLNEANIKATVLQGSYYMERPGSSKSRAIMPTFPSISNKFMIKTAILLAPGNTDAQTLGILFMVQSDGSGGFVFEINKKQQFRVRGIVSAGQYITQGENGWLKSKNLVANEFNKVVIKGFGGSFDIYINDVYNFSFKNASFKTGDVGVLIGPEAKGKVDFFYVYNLNASMPEIVEKESVASELEKLRQENDSLKLELAGKPASNFQDAEAAIKILEQQLESVNNENALLKKKAGQNTGAGVKQLLVKIDSLEAENKRMLQVIELLEAGTKNEEAPQNPANTNTPINKETGKKEGE